MCDQRVPILRQGVGRIGRGIVRPRARSMVNKQAAMIAYIDDFYLMAWISIAVLPLVLLLQKPKGKVEVVHAE